MRSESTTHASPGIYEIQDLPIIPWLVMKGNFGGICVCFFALAKLAKDHEDASRLMAAVGPASSGLWLKRGGHQRGLSCGVSRFQGAAYEHIRRHFCGQIAKGQATSDQPG